LASQKLFGCFHERIDTSETTKFKGLCRLAIMELDKHLGRLCFGQNLLVLQQYKLAFCVWLAHGSWKCPKPICNFFLYIIYSC